MSYLGYVSPPFIVSIGVYHCSSSPPQTIQANLEIYVHPLLQPDTAHLKLYGAGKVWDLGVCAIKPIAPSLYGCTLDVSISDIKLLAEFAGFPFGLNIVNMPKSLDLQGPGPLTVIRLSGLLPQEELTQPVIGVAVFDAGWSVCGEYSIEYRGAIYQDLGIRIWRHDFEPLIIPLFTHLGGAGEIFAVFKYGEIVADPGSGGAQVRVHYQSLPIQGLPRMRTYIQLFSAGKPVGSIEDYVYPIILWVCIPNMVGDRLLEPQAVTVAPTFKILL